MTRFPWSRSQPVHRSMLVCGCSLSLACAVDDRPVSILTPPSGNGDSGASGNIPGGSAGTSNQLPGAVPDDSPPNAAGAGGATTGEGPPNPALPLNGGGGNGAAGSTSTMGSSGSGPGAAGAAGTIVDPGETEVIGGCFNQLLANGGFERGHTAWAELSEAVHDVIVQRDASVLIPTGVAPQAGDYLAWIGGIPNGDFRMYHTSLSQTVTIPAEALSLTMSGYYWVSQPELGRMPFDWAVLELEDPDPNDLGIWQVVEPPFSDQSVTNGWVYFETTTVDAEQVSAGKNLTVKASSTPNGNGTLSVWLDSLRLEARCPR